MKDGDHRIWSDADLNLDDWRDDLIEQYPPGISMSEDELYQRMVATNRDYLEDERVNLDIRLSQPILVIADLGFWNGRCSGYKEIQSGNIRDCLSSDCDFNTWYVDKYGDLRCDAYHHDGTNHYLYRVYKDNVSEEKRNNLTAKIRKGTFTRADVTRLTRRLGDEIGAVYGWSFPQRGRPRKESVV